MWTDEGILPARGYYNNVLMLQKEQWSIEVDNNEMLIIAKIILKKNAENIYLFFILGLDVSSITSTSQLSWSDGFQSLVSKLSRTTIFKSQHQDMYSICFSYISGLPVGNTLDMRWKGSWQK